MQRVDTRTGAVRIVAKLPAPLAHACTVTIGSSIYVLGGRSGSRVQTGILKFDPVTNVISSAGSLVLGESDGAATVLSDRAFLFGGEAGNPRKPVANVEVIK